MEPKRKDAHVRDSPVEGLAELLLAAADSAADAQRLAAALLASFGSITAILRARTDVLATVPGMTMGALRTIIAVEKLTCRMAEEVIPVRDHIASRAQFEQYARLKLRGRTTEAAYGFFLNRENFLIREVKLGEGTIHQVVLYPREIVRIALSLDASAVVLLHNHPSGNPTPSLADIEFTKESASLLATFDIALHDHYIVGANHMVSLRERTRF